MSKENKCAKCGACSTVCPVYQVRGRESLTARGKHHLLAHLDPAAASAAYAEILSNCLLCGACRDVCPRSLENPAIFAEARSRLSRVAGEHIFLRSIIKAGLASPGLQQTLSRLAAPILARLPADSGLRIRLGLPVGEREPLPPPDTPPPSTAGGAIDYFTGCYARHVNTEIKAATERLTQKATGSPPAAPHSQCCCGLAAYSSGDLDTACRLARQNILAFATGSQPILTSCASCFSHLASYPRLLADDPEFREEAIKFSARLVEFSSFFQPLLTDAAFSGRNSTACRVYYHDPCHLRFAKKITAPPRLLLQQAPGLKLAEPTSGPACCGQGGLFHLAHPGFAEDILNGLQKKIKASDAAAVTTTCTGCLLHIGQGLAREKGIRVVHLAVLLAELLAGQKEI